MTFANPDGTFENETFSMPVTLYVPTTGSTITIPASVRKAFINPAGTIAALTIKLSGSPGNGHLVDIMFGQTVTAITWQDASGATITGTGLPSAGSANAGTEVVYMATSLTPGAPTRKWIKWR